MMGDSFVMKVTCGIYNIHSISTSMIEKGIFLWNLTCTLGDFCVTIIINVICFFIDGLISHLQKIVTSFILITRDLLSFSYLIGTLVVCGFYI